MIRLRSGWSLLILAALPTVAPAQQRVRDADLIFKDGYHIRGKVEESVKEFLFDPASGRAFTIPSGNFSIDDHVRHIKFSPRYVQKVVLLKPGEIKEPTKIVRIKQVSDGYEVNSKWRFDHFSKWDERGERTVTVHIKAVKEGDKILKQKIGVLTPHYLYAITIDHNWELRYATQEFGPEQTRAILLNVFNETKEMRAMKPAEKFMKIAAFMHEAGWFAEAEKELAAIADTYPAAKKDAEEMLAKVRRDRAELFAESIKKASEVGQHQEAIDRLDTYDREGYGKLVSPALASIAKDKRVDYDKAKADIDAARQYLKDLPASMLGKKPAIWTKATEYILEELNYDTFDRLDEFLKAARQHERQRKAKAELTQNAEQVLATAVTGWLQGEKNAVPDVKAALKLAEAREFLLQYLHPDNEGKRPNLLSTFRQKNDLPIDVLTRLVRMIPPPDAHPVKQIDTQIQTMDISGGNGGSYLLQLPPDYHHLRNHPVLIVLHSSRDKADDTLKRFSDEAAKHGFILAAPLWVGKNVLGGKFQFGQKEHNLVLDTIKDLRCRFQVDSDRVLLFGWEDAGTMAFDIGLEHPDQFAGVIPMNGTMTAFTRKFYWPNAQYLPFYVIEGDKNGNKAIQMRDLFAKEWTRDPFVNMYVEYKGRGSEWFSAEIPRIFDWGSRRKRHTPMKEMGRNGGEEFRSSRAAENRFYWLTYKDIAARYQKWPSEEKWAMSYQPAKFQAHLATGNILKKSTGKEEIWTRATVNVSLGVAGLCLWITPEMMPDMMDSAKPKLLEVYVNGNAIGGRRPIAPNLETMLEALVETGDRQRLFVAKIEIR